MISQAKKLSVWKPLRLRQGVVLRTYRKGSRGVIIERLREPHQNNGLDMYAVKLETNETVDMLRYELKKIRGFRL